jgi:hypothetical protein
MLVRRGLLRLSCSYAAMLLSGCKSPDKTAEVPEPSKVTQSFNSKARTKARMTDGSIAEFYGDFSLVDRDGTPLISFKGYKGEPRGVALYRLRDTSGKVTCWLQYYVQPSWSGLIYFNAKFVGNNSILYTDGEIPSTTLVRNCTGRGCS